MPPPLSRFFATRPPAVVVILTAAVVLVLVGGTDWLTSADVSLGLFYLMPVALVTWYLGGPAGAVASVVSAAAWLVVSRAGPYPSPRPLVAWWNATAGLLFFLVVTTLLASVRNSRRRLESVVELRTASLRQLARELAAAEEAQRSQIAYDIHDGLGQVLVGLKFEIEMAASEAEPGSRHAARLEKAIETLLEAIRQARTLMFELQPLTLDEVGLVPTLQRYGEEFGDARGIAVPVSEVGIPQPLPREIARYLFRAVKELCSNAFRHGGAKRVTVVVCWNAGSVRTEVRDDGSGFDPARLGTPENRRGLGLAGIAERVHAMGGTLRIDSQPGEGTFAVIELPVQPPIAA